MIALLCGLALCAAFFAGIWIGSEPSPCECDNMYGDHERGCEWYAQELRRRGRRR